MSMAPQDLPSSQIPSLTATNHHTSHSQRTHQHLQLYQDRNPVSLSTGSNLTQIGSNRIFTLDQPLMLINPGHHLSIEASKGGKHSQEQNHLSRPLDSYSSGAFHVVARSTRSEGNDRKPPGSSNSSIHKPTLTVVAPPMAPDLQADRGKVAKLPVDQQLGYECNGAGQKYEGHWLSQLQQQQYQDPRSLYRQQKQNEHLRSLQEQGHQQQKYEHQRLLQQQEQQYEHTRSLQQQEQQYEHTRSLQQQEQQYEHTRSLQQQEQQYEHTRSLQQQEQQYEHTRSLQQQEQQYETQISLQRDVQILHHLEHQQQQYEHLRSSQQKRNHHMLSNHNEKTSPFGVVNNSSQDHNFHQRHYQEHSNHHYPLQQQQQQNTPSLTTSHLLHRSSAFSPTASASSAVPHLISEAKPGHINIPVILISSPPPQEQNRQKASSPRSSLLSPKLLEDASTKSTISKATLHVPPVRHQHSRSPNPSSKSRPLILSRPHPPPRPLNLSRPDPPPRPLTLSRSDPPPFISRHIDFQPIDKPHETHLDVDTPLDETPPPERPLRMSSSLLSPPTTVSQEERTHPLALNSPILQKPSSNRHDSPNLPTLDRPPCVTQESATLQLPKRRLHFGQQEERTSPSTTTAFISPTPQKPSPYPQDSSHTSSAPSCNSYNLQLPPSHPERLVGSQVENAASLISPNRISPTIHSSLHRHRETSHRMPGDKPVPARKPLTRQRPISYHGDLNPLSLSERPLPPEPPARICSTMQISSSHHRDLSRSLPAVTPSPPALSTRIQTTLHSQFISKENLNSSSSRVTPPCSPSANDRTSPGSRDTKHPALATVENLSTVKLRPVRDSFTRPRDLIPLYPGEATTGSVNYRLRPTSGRFSNIYKTESERTTLPSPPAADDLDELPPPPPPHELVLSPEDLAILARDSCGGAHEHTDSSGTHLAKLQARIPAGESNSSQIYHQHIPQFQLRHQAIQSPTHQDNFRNVPDTPGREINSWAEVGYTPVLERLQTANMSNMDFEIPDDVDLSQCPGLVEINSSTPNWKRDMVEKKNQEKIEEYVKKILKEREQEAKWKNIPEWKKKILQKKEEEEGAGSSPVPETKTSGKKSETKSDSKKPETKADSKKPEIKADSEPETMVKLKKAVKKPPPPPPKDTKEDYSSHKAKGDIVPAALSIDPEELAAMPPWKRELLFKRDKVPVTFSNEYNPDEDSTADSNNTS